VLLTLHFDLSIKMDSKNLHLVLVLQMYPR